MPSALRDHFPRRVRVHPPGGAPDRVHLMRGSSPTSQTLCSRDFATEPAPEGCGLPLCPACARTAQRRRERAGAAPCAHEWVPRPGWQSRHCRRCGMSEAFL
jgi:hypothetical protein